MREVIYGTKIRPRWWSLLNWLQGYKFGPVRRHRCCDHTTPGHYGWCGEQESWIKRAYENRGRR